MLLGRLKKSLGSSQEMEIKGGKYETDNKGLKGN
jgi:hypothetical protein